MNIFDLSFKEFTQYVKKIKYGYIECQLEKGSINTILGRPREWYLRAA